MSSIREALLANGLERLINPIEAAVKHSLYLTVGEQSEDPCSRLGGRPNLPENVEWPHWRGKALPFVAQLDLAALPRIPGFELPVEGSLYFFYEGGEQAWGFEPADKGSAQVVYVPNSNLREHPLRPFPEEIADHLRFSGTELLPEAVDLSVPDSEDPYIQGLSLSAEEFNAYYDFFPAWREQMPPTFYRVGGYPEPSQNDPKLQAHLVSQGLNCGTSSGYDQGEEQGLYAGVEDWELLLQVGSDENLGMMWGDAGELYFLIRKQDLQQRLFEKTWLVFQCG